MKKILALIMFIHMPYLLGSGFVDTTSKTKDWYDGNGSTYDQPTPNGYTASNPIPLCPRSGVYLKNNSPRQETFTVTFVDNSQHALSLLPNDTRCIHTTKAHKIQNISIFPFLGPQQTTVSNGTDDLMSTGFNGSGDGSSFNGSSFTSSAPDQLPPPPFSPQQTEHYTKTFSQFFKDTLYYPLSSANKHCRTMTYSGFTLQCWKSSPNLGPMYQLLPATHIIPSGKKG